MFQVKLLGPGLVKREIIDDEEVITPITMLPNVIELAYYSNCVVQHFILQSVVASAINTKDLETGFVSQDILVQKTLELCDILQYEFLFCKPCQSLETTVTNTIDDMMLKEVFILHAPVETRMSKRLQEELFDDETNEGLQKVPEYEIVKSDKNVQYLRFLRNILKQWLEPYSISAQCLERVVETEMVEQDFVKDVLREMKEQFEMGTITYGKTYNYFYIKKLLR